MTSQMAHIAAQSPVPAWLNRSIAIAIAWTALMGFQLLQSMRIDAYELSQSRYDLLGYWSAFLMSLILGLSLLNRGRMMLEPLLLIIALLTYIALIIALTAPSKSMISLMISRYGVIMWFVLGIGFSAVTEILSLARRRRRAGYAIKIVTALLAILGLQALGLAREVFSEPLQTIGYQSVANSATIFLIIVAGIIVALWDERVPITVSLAYISIGTVLVVAVALTQSTLIVVLWVGILAMLFGQLFRQSRVVTKLVFWTIILLFAWYFMQTEGFGAFTTKTRFATFFAFTGEFTSWESRVSLLSTFPEQFAVSPIFGNFEAEVVSGVGEGLYVHSIPLSFLTHTGLFGTALFFSVFFLLIWKHTVGGQGLDSSAINLGRMTWMVIGVGSISTFFLWPVMWFMMGALCKHPMRNS